MEIAKEGYDEAQKDSNSFSSYSVCCNDSSGISRNSQGRYWGLSRLCGFVLRIWETSFAMGLCFQKRSQQALPQHGTG